MLAIKTNSPNYFGGSTKTRTIYCGVTILSLKYLMVKNTVSRYFRLEYNVLKPWKFLGHRQCQCYHTPTFRGPALVSSTSQIQSQLREIPARVIGCSIYIQTKFIWCSIYFETKNIFCRIHFHTKIIGCSTYFQTKTFVVAYTFKLKSSDVTYTFELKSTVVANALKGIPSVVSYIFKLFLRTFPSKNYASWLITSAYMSTCKDRRTAEQNFIKFNIRQLY